LFDPKKHGVVVRSVEELAFYQAPRTEFVNFSRPGTAIACEHEIEDLPATSGQRSS
jgi:hypothetical protein